MCSSDLVIVPTKEEDGEQWANFNDNRDLRGLDNWCCNDADEVDTRKFNMLPPGMELANQWRSEQNKQPLVMAGESDVSKDTNGSAFMNGFTRRKMRGTDDLYTGEHVDHFYGDAGGFSERNNYLDRI